LKTSKNTSKPEKMVQLQGLACALLPMITESYIFLESESQIKLSTETTDYVGNLADNHRPGLRMLSSASRPPKSLSPAEKKKEFLGKLIGYFQPEARAENFINYGCWCFNDDNDVTKGHGHPVDRVDETCRSHSYCYQCTKMAFDCSVYSGYKYFGREDVNGTRSMECLNDEFGDPSEQCRHTLCECDKRLAQQLAKHTSAWSIENHEKFGDFEQSACKAGHKTSSPARISGSNQIQQVSSESQSQNSNQNSNLDQNMSQGPLRLVGGPLSNSEFGNSEIGESEIASSEELEQFYTDNVQGDYFSDIYDSQNDVQESDYSSEVQSEDGDLRNLFSSSVISGNQGNGGQTGQKDQTEHQCCGDAPTWFPYNTAQGRRACCHGKTYDTTILKCCDDGSLRSTC